MDEGVQIFRTSTVPAAKPQPGFKEIKKRDPGDIILIRKKGVILTFETSCAGGAPLRMTTANCGQKILVAKSNFMLAIQRMQAQNEHHF